jgi:hypothetical protein
VITFRVWVSTHYVAFCFAEKQGISSRFVAYIKGLDASLGKHVTGPEGGPTTLSGKVTDRAKQIDEQQGITAKATTYYEKAIASPFGQKVHNLKLSRTGKELTTILGVCVLYVYCQASP